MIRDTDTHKITLIAVALTAVMMLSVFAMPAAAASVSNSAAITVNADDVADSGSATDTGELELGLDSDDSTISDGSTEIITLSAETDYSFKGVGDVSISGGNSSNIDSVYGYVVGPDTVEIVLDNDRDSSSDFVPSGDETITVSNLEVAVSTTTAGTETAAVVNSTDSYGFSSDADAVRATVTAGAPDSVSVSANNNTIQYDGGSSDITAEVTDQFDNPVSDQEVTFNVGDQSTTATTGDNGQATVTIPENGDLTNTVGELAVTASAGDVTSSETTLTVTPNQIGVNADPPGFDADTGETTVTVELQNDSGDVIPDANVTQSEITFSDSNGPEAGTINGDDLTKEPVVLTTNGSTDVTFASTTAGEYDLQAAVLGVTGSQSITVTAGAPDSVSVSVGDNDKTIQYDGGSSDITAEVTDQFDNPVSDQEVTFNVGDQSTTATTGDNGQATVTIPENGDLTNTVGELAVTASAGDVTSSETTLTVTPNQVNVTEEQSGAADGDAAMVSVAMEDSQGTIIEEAATAEISVESIPDDATVLISDSTLSSAEDSVSVELTGGTAEFSVDSDVASEYTVTADVLTTEGETTATIEPGTISNIKVIQSPDIVGVVDDDQTSADIKIEAYDDNGNQIQNAQDAIDFTSQPTGVHDVTKGIDNGAASYDVLSNVDKETSTGEVTITVSASAEDVSVSETVTVSLVHEALNLDEGYQRFSTPMDVDNVVHTDVGDITTWNTSAGSYETGDLTNVNRGFYVEGDSPDARIGLAYDTATLETPGSATLDAGWNLVGSNFDITEQSTVSVGDDLTSNVERVTGVGKTGDVSAYESYWVYVDSEQTRPLVEDTYDASARSTIVSQSN